jgi:regulator of protease activity HflC (stomatin/prohibitin superfamily)
LSDSSGPVAWFVGILVCIGLVVGVICLIGWISAFESTGPGEVCVVQEGGPFDGRSVKEVRQGGEGVQNIGIWNSQNCFPSTQRNYIISADPSEADSKKIDFVEVPTRDATNVRVEGQALFRLNTDPAVMKDFYRKYGVRTFDGKHPYEGDDGWRNFLSVQFRPVLDNALREAIGDFRCVELNNTCQYVQNAQEALKGNVKEVNNSQNLANAQRQIEQTLQRDLNTTLGGPFFEDVRFRLRGVKFAPQVQHQITAAQTKATQVATQKLEADRQVAEAEGQRKVAAQNAAAIRIKAKGYRSNPAQARIDAIRAFCGSGGCHPQVIGNNVLNNLGR